MSDATRQALDRALAGLDLSSVPGDGSTAARWLGLFDLASQIDVSIARLVEAHLDASAILLEAGHQPRGACRYGVWASVRPDGRDVELLDGRVSGMKSFGSGIGVIDRALVEVLRDGRRQLVDVDASVAWDGETWRSADGRRSATIEWATEALASTNTGSMRFDQVDDVEPVGPPDWYLDRVGFWHGACGPAACWGGGAAGLVDYLRTGGDPHRAAGAGAITAAVWTMRAVLRQAGDEADRAPHDVDEARRRARIVRHTIHEQATSVLDEFMRTAGPGPMVDGRGAGQRIADVQLYLRQHHGRRDLAELGGGGPRSDGGGPRSDGGGGPRSDHGGVPRSDQDGPS
jgi:hypothetical protein